TGGRAPERAGGLVVAVAALALAVLAVQGAAWSTGRALAGAVAAERHAPCHGQHAAASIL
ncbi:MAG TPA: hypothetical protein VNO79_08670, partial [Actinomycetota bacterium]|nr:hypothetical protein [Actinomycetota bacterium]